MIPCGDTAPAPEKRTYSYALAGGDPGRLLMGYPGPHLLRRERFTEVCLARARVLTTQGHASDGTDGSASFAARASCCVLATGCCRAPVAARSSTRHLLFSKPRKRAATAPECPTAYMATMANTNTPRREDTAGAPHSSVPRRPIRHTWGVT